MSVEADQEEKDPAVAIAERALQKATRIETEYQQEIDRLETTIQSLRDELNTAYDQIHDIEEQRSLSEITIDGSRLKPAERASILIQTLYNEANSRNDHQSVASMDYKLAEAALGSELDRRQIYDAMDHAESIVDDTDLLEFVKEPRRTDRNSRLVLDLTQRDLPSNIINNGGDMT